jgi:hypothetical protein
VTPILTTECRGTAVAVVGAALAVAAITLDAMVAMLADADGFVLR